MDTRTPGILRHLGAMLYDLLMVFALLMVATTVVIVPMSLQGEEVSIGENALFRLYLVLVAAGYYLWFWTHGGQTVGMKTWRFRLTDENGETPGYAASLKRLVLAILLNAACLAGFLWRLFDPGKRTLYDRLSGTWLRQVPKS
ncbi:MAG: RDD family protein [Gammaproteobacteria bacterium]|jgi:uncharacterized RDD family membrane protein YckC